jgi:NAD(P)-dependent dehydrogenase (short-subunit alcohol dehydrogenase family)
MDLQLQDRVVLVVGGAGYIGSAVTERLRAEGATVVVASRSGSGDGIALDAGDDASVSAGIADVLARHGRIDGLVMTAAPSARTLDPARNADPAQVLAATDAKALGFLRVANAVLPGMRERGSGRVVVISGQNAWLTGNVTAAVRNAATNVIAKNLADEVVEDGVTVNVVNPGIVSDQPSASVEPGRGGESSPQQIADLVAFLVSPLSVVSGESIAIGLRVKGIATV